MTSLQYLNEQPNFNAENILNPTGIKLLSFTPTMDKAFSEDETVSCCHYEFSIESDLYDL